MSISLDDKPKVFASTLSRKNSAYRTDPVRRVNQFGLVDLDDGAKNTAKLDDESRKSRPKTFLSTEFDDILTDDKEWEPTLDVSGINGKMQ